ncbi:hypothetical protein [Actinomadura livida]|uniref:Uncharacterized protein n=1 Tax=Actinomadura livida TaxID=79909 RepID=A0A7W7I829_9ACTN|nr:MULTISPECIES: hypothetical protein [Actinomadura]MBB4772126.1 hypothetical protein [Actinomadura catellatispora]GGU37507.1 hypothetical protein GCM10010208_72460 [Actinomadura livida]
MTRPFHAVAVLMLGATLVLTGCQVNSHTCRGGECHVTTTGTGKTQSIDQWDVKITEIYADSAVFSVDRSRGVRIQVGRSVRVRDARITVTSIEGETVKYDIE